MSFPDSNLLARLVHAALVGAGATLCIDLWNAALRRLGIPSLNYCFLGRWVGHFPRGTVRHRRIVESPPVAFECGLGWGAHYAIGVGLAVALLFIVPAWYARPSVVVALVYGIATVILPFFLLQPALGLGVASSATPRPALARLKSLATHMVYGLGLYTWAWLLGPFMS